MVRNVALSGVKFQCFPVFYILEHRWPQGGSFLLFVQYQQMKHSPNQKNQTKLATYQPTDISQLHSNLQSPSQSQSECFYPSRSSAFADCTILSSEESMEISVVSLGKDILKEHLGWLEYSIQRVSSCLLKIAYDQGNLDLFHSHQVYLQESFLQYLHKQLSLIHPLHLPFFIDYLSTQHNLREALESIYQIAPTRICDELILVAFRIVLAYLPIKKSGLSLAELQSISRVPLNVANIYSFPPLRVLHLQQLHRWVNGQLVFNGQLYFFFQSYIDTILLIIEQYFHNPHCSSHQYRGYQQSQKSIRQNPTKMTQIKNNEKR